MTQEYVLALKVTADGKLAVKGMADVDDAQRRVTNSVKQAASDTDKARAAVDQYIASVRRKTETLGMSAAQLRLYDAAQLGATKRDLEAIRALNSHIKEHESLQVAQAGSAAGFGRVGSAVAGFLTVAAGLSALKNVIGYLFETTDNATLAAARIRMVTSSQTEQIQVSEALLRVANELQLPAKELLDSYPRIARAIKEVGGSTKDSTDMLRAHSIAVKLSGATQAEATASALQFAQALQSGRLQGDEFRSIMENNGKLAEALARGLGVTTGQLRAMSQEGQLTTKKIMDALLSQLPALEAQAASMPKTVAGAWAVYNNELEKSIATDKRMIESQQALARALEINAKAIRMMREERDMYAVEPPTDVKNKGVLAIARWRNDQRAGKVGVPGEGNQQQVRALDNGLIAQGDLAAANARMNFNEALKGTNTPDSVAQKFNDDIGKIAQSYGELAIKGKATAEDTRRYESNIVALMKEHAVAQENLSKVGLATFSAIAAAEERDLTLKRARFEQQAVLAQDSAKRDLAALDFEHQMGLISERDYINEKADMQRQSTTAELAVVRWNLDQQRALRAKESAIPAIGAQAQLEKKAKLSELDKTILDLETKQEITNRNLNDIDGHRIENHTQLNKQIQEQLTGIKRQSEDLVRGNEEETAAMQLQLDLIGKTDVITQQMTIAAKTQNALSRERVRLERELQDLKKGNADPSVIQAAIDGSAANVDSINKGGEDQKVLAEKIISDQTKDRISQRIAEALVKGGKDSGKQILQILQDELMNQLLIVPVKLLVKEGIDAITAALGPQFGMIAALSSLGGGLGAKALGAGEKGVKVGTIVGLLTGIIPGMLAGYFTDPNGPANRTGQFGTAPGGQYDDKGGSAFGTYGTFDTHWFGDDMNAKMKEFLASLTGIENKIAGILTPDELARVRATVNTPKEYSFGTEHGDFESELLVILRDRMSAVVEAVLPGLGHLVTEFQGTGEELMAFTGSLLEMKNGAADIDKLIKQVTENAGAVIEAQLDQLKAQIDSAQIAFDQAMEAKDPAKILAAENQLTAAIMQSYQQRVQLARQLQENIAQAEDQAYQFLINMAGKINAVGGKVNVGNIASGRAESLWSQIGGVGAGNIAGQIRNLNAYVGARETEYNARRAAIIAAAEAQAQANQAIANAQKSAADSQIAGLQKLLQLAGQFASVVDATSRILDELKYSASNPLHGLGRLALATDDLAALKAAYEAASGAGKISAANAYSGALQGRLTLAQDAGVQRPTAEYMAYYNETVAELTRVRADALTESERAAAIQEHIATLQEQSAAYAQVTADATSIAQGQLDQLNAEFVAYYTDANSMGDRLYTEQIRIAKENLDLVTGGQDIELFAAQIAKESRDLLTQIRDGVVGFLQAAGGTITSGGSIVVNPVGGGNTGGGGDNVGGGAGSVSQMQTPLVIKIGDTTFTNAVLNVATQNGRVIRQTVEQS